MKNWNAKAFNAAVEKYQKFCLKNRKDVEKKAKGYRLWETMQIYDYIADVILKGAVVGSTVVGWTKETSNGPTKVNGQILEEFFGASFTTKEEKGNREMKANYTDFIKERVYEVHCAVCAYLDERGEEEAFWKMCDVIDKAKVALPKTVYEAVQGFVDQYLEADLFGAIYSRKERVDFDLKDMVETEKECPNPDVGEDHVEWFKLHCMYENIAEKYIRPVLIEE